MRRLQRAHFQSRRLFMGRDSNISCVDCKKSYYLGHQGYSTWLDGCGTVEDFDRHLQRDPSRFMGNQNRAVRWVLAEHAGHNIKQWCGDYSREGKGGHLYFNDTVNEDELWIENHASFERFDLQRNPVPGGCLKCNADATGRIQDWPNGFIDFCGNHFDEALRKRLLTPICMTCGKRDQSIKEHIGGWELCEACKQKKIDAGDDFNEDLVVVISNVIKRQPG